MASLRGPRSTWLYSSRAGTPSSSRSNCRGSSNKFAARLRMPLLTPQGHRFGVLSPHCAPGHKLPNQAPGHPWIFDLRSISMHDRILTVDPTEYPSWTVATIEIHGEYRKVREEAGGYTIAYPTFNGPATRSAFFLKDPVCANSMISSCTSPCAAGDCQVRALKGHYQSRKRDWRIKRPCAVVRRPSMNGAGVMASGSFHNRPEFSSGGGA